MIAFLIEDLNVCGGTHKQLLKLLDYSAKNGVDFFVVTKNLDLSRTYSGFLKYQSRIIVFKEKNIHAQNIWVSKYNWLINKISLRRIIKQADIINIHDCGWEFDLPVFWNKKVYWQINDLPYWYALGAHSNLVSLAGREILIKKTNRYLKYVDAITVNVRKNADRILQYMGRQAKVLYCGIDPIAANRNVANTRERFSNNKVNLLSSGVFQPYRNYETLVELVRILKKDGCDATLRIIGACRDLSYAEKIRTMIHDNGLDNSVIIEGQVDVDKFNELHTDSDIFLFVNKDQSWGLAVFEAMSAGLPVVVSKSVGATEILEDYVNSIFVDPENAEEIALVVKNLISNPELYDRIVVNSKTFHTNWTWEDSYCSKMLQLMTTNE